VQVSVGRSAACDIALPEARRFQLEHLNLRPQPDGMEFSLQDARSAPLLFHGHPLTSCTVPWEDEVFSAGIRFKPEQARGGEARKKAALAALPLLGALLLVGVSWLSSGEDGSAAFSLADRKPPALWEGRVDCSQPAAAETRAREAEAAALAKMQRYRFEARDGLQALRLLREARQCYAAGGREGEAARVEKKADAWQERLQGDYEGHLLRLRLAQQKKDGGETLREVRALRALLAHRNGEYLSWLTHLERRLESRGNDVDRRIQE
jgi:hypothetical protein